MVANARLASLELELLLVDPKPRHRERESRARSLIEPDFLRRAYDEFFVQLELTLALALTETLMLADALIDASTAVPAHAMALPPKFADPLTTTCPVAATFWSALTAS